MFDKPPINDATIIASIQDHFGLNITSLAFLPLGKDSHAGVYRATAHDGQVYFLKVKSDAIHESGLVVSRYLNDNGLSEIVAPLPTIEGRLWTKVDQFTLLLYPFVEGETVWCGLSERQWVQYGAFLKKLHTIRLPEDLRAQLPIDDFVPRARWSRIAHQIHTTVQHQHADDPTAAELGAFWREKHDNISQIFDRADRLGRRLQQQSLDFVVCHADIHTANVILAPNGALFVVDWDEVMLAPKERDLLFAVVGSFVSEKRHEELIFQGYGPPNINLLALTYYHYARIVEELGGCAEPVLLMESTSDATKRDAVRGFRAMFGPGELVEAAHWLAHRLSQP